VAADGSHDTLREGEEGGTGGDDGERKGHRGMIGSGIRGGRGAALAVVCWGSSVKGANVFNQPHCSCSQLEACLLVTHKILPVYGHDLKSR
jgi:hypothetical protein